MLGIAGAVAVLLALSLLWWIGTVLRGVTLGLLAVSDRLEEIREELRKLH